MNRLLKSLIWIAAIIIVVLIVVPVVYRIGYSMYRWAWAKPTTQQVVHPTTSNQEPVATPMPATQAPVATPMPATQAPVATPITQKEESNTERCQAFSITFGKMGSFHGEYDTNIGRCVIGIWESSRVKNTTGISLADLKIQGDKYTIIMPFDGYVNHSANTVLVNAVKCTPGNPVKCVDGKTLFTKGTPIEFISDPGNDSSGTMLIEHN